MPSVSIPAVVINFCSDVLERYGARPVRRVRSGDPRLDPQRLSPRICVRCQHPMAIHGIAGDCFDPRCPPAWCGYRVSDEMLELSRHLAGC